MLGLWQKLQKLPVLMLYDMSWCEDQSDYVSISIDPNATTVPYSWNIGKATCV